MLFIRIQYSMHLPILAKLASADFKSNKPPQQVLQVMHYTEAPCFPQKMRQIIGSNSHASSTVPSSNTQISQIEFDAFLPESSFSEDDINESHKHAKSLHSYSDKQRCRGSKMILKIRRCKHKRNREHKYWKGHRTASTVLPRTEYRTAPQRNARLNAIETSRT